MPISIDWQTNCTKIFIGDQSVAQPIFYISQGDFYVCTACALTCYTQDKITQVFNNEKYGCKCSQHTDCLFMIRSALGEEILPSNHINKLCNVMESASIL